MIIPAKTNAVQSTLAANLPRSALSGKNRTKRKSKNEDNQHTENENEDQRPLLNGIEVQGPCESTCQFDEVPACLSQFLPEYLLVIRSQEPF